MRSWPIIVLGFLEMLAGKQAWGATGSTCPARLRAIQLESSCLQQGTNECRDLCQGSSPQLSPACFQPIELSCDVIQKIKEKGVAGESIPVVGLKALFDYYRQSPEDEFAYLYLLAQEIEAKDFSIFNRIQAGSSVVTAENFKLNIRQDVSTFLKVFHDAGLYKRYTTAEKMELYFPRYLEQRIFPAIQNHPLLSDSDKKLLKDEISNSWQDALEKWMQLKAKFPLKTFMASRAKALNSRIKNLSRQSLASMDRFEGNFNAALKDEAVKGCSFDNVTACQLTVLDSMASQDLAALDRQWNELEKKLELLDQEATALKGEVTDFALDTPPSDEWEYGGSLGSASFSRPQTWKKEYQRLINEPSDYNLNRLRAAVSAGSYQGFANAETIWNNLLAKGTKKVKGQHFYAARSDLALKSCQAIEDRASALKAIEQEVNRLQIELIQRTEDYRLAPTQENMAKVSQVLDAINQKTAEAGRFGDPKLFEADRLDRFVWFLGQDLPADAQVNLEMLEWEGTFWTANIPLPVSIVFPELDNVMTEFGSLRNGGAAQLGPNGWLQVLRRGSPYSACAKANTIRAIVRIQTSQGEERILLE